MGCRNGEIYSYDISPQKGDPTLFKADPYFLSNDSTLIRTIAYFRSDSTVWAGSNSGDLQVWYSWPLKGVLAAENLYHTGVVNIVEFPPKAPYTLSLICGTLTWGTQFISKQSVLISQITRVWLSNVQEFSVSLQSKVYKFRTESKEAAEEWIRILNFGMRCTRLKWVLYRKAYRRITLPCSSELVAIISIQEIDGTAWVLDGTMRLTEWVLLKDRTGMMRGAYELSPGRQVVLNVGEMGSGLCIVSGPVVHVEEDILWVSVGDRFAKVMKKNLFQSRKGVQSLLQLDYIKRNSDSSLCRQEIIQDAIIVQVQNRVEIWSGNSVGELLMWDANGNILKVLQVGSQDSFITCLTQVGENEVRMISFWFCV